MRPIQRAVVYSRDAERRQAFATRMEATLGIPVVAADSPEAAVAEADIVVTMTNASDPVFRGDALRHGTHINAVGANRRDRRELDAEAVSACDRIVVDDLAQAQEECGDLISLVGQELPSWEGVAELSAVVSEQVVGRSGPESITLFESQGVGVQDVALAMHAYRKAVERGVGQSL